MAGTISLSSETAEAIASQCALEDDVEAWQLADHVKALHSRFLREREPKEGPVKAGFSPITAPTEWTALGKLFSSARTAEAKERVLHSIGNYMIHNRQSAAIFLEALRIGCRPSEAPSTRLASMKALQVSGMSIKWPYSV